MIQEEIEVITEKKVWEVPSLDKLQITHTFGGKGMDYESNQGSIGSNT